MSISKSLKEMIELASRSENLTPKDVLCILNAERMLKLEISDSELIDWLESRTNDSSYHLSLRKVRDPKIDAGMIRTEIVVGVGSGMNARKTEGSSLRDAIKKAIADRKEALCVSAYGEHWPKIKSHLSAMQNIVDKIRNQRDI